MGFINSPPPLNTNQWESSMGERGPCVRGCECSSWTERLASRGLIPPAICFILSTPLPFCSFPPPQEQLILLSLFTSALSSLASPPTPIKVVEALMRLEADLKFRSWAYGRQADPFCM